MTAPILVATIPVPVLWACVSSIEMILVLGLFYAQVWELIVLLRTSYCGNGVLACSAEPAEVLVGYKVQATSVRWNNQISTDWCIPSMAVLTGVYLGSRTEWNAELIHLHSSLPKCIHRINSSLTWESVAIVTRQRLHDVPGVRRPWWDLAVTLDAVDKLWAAIL